MKLARLMTAAAVSALLAGAAQAQTPAAPARPMTPAAPAPSATPAQPATPAAPAASAMAMPAAAGDLVQTAQAAGKFSILLKAADATNLTPVLKGAGPLTIFAPTDEAFAALPAGELDRLMLPANRPELQKLLLAHIVNTSVPASTVAGKKGEVQNGAGAKLMVDGSGPSVMVNNATVIQADIKARNGIIHVVDKVIMPGSAATASASASAGAAGADASSTNSTDMAEPADGAAPPAATPPAAPTMPPST